MFTRWSGLRSKVIIATSLICGYIVATTEVKADLPADHSEQMHDRNCAFQKPFFIRLSESQIEKAHNIQNQFLDSQEPLIANLKRLHRQLFDALNQLNLDKSEILSIQSKISSTESELASLRAQNMILIHELLTPDQRQELRKMHLEHVALGPMKGRMMPPFGPLPQPPMPPEFAYMLFPLSNFGDLGLPPLPAFPPEMSGMPMP